MTEDIKNIIVSMSKEFDEKKGCVTCEISIKSDQILEFLHFVKNETTILYGKWVISNCETCEKYNGSNYVHVEIMDYH